MGEILYGDSIESLSNLNENIDLFINDSDHSAVYERNEYLTIINKLNTNSVILGDNSHSTDELLNFSIINKRNFVLFKEKFILPCSSTLNIAIFTLSVVGLIVLSLLDNNFFPFTKPDITLIDITYC